MSRVAWQAKQPLTTYIRQQRVVDAQLRKVLLAAANDARRRAMAITDNNLRRAQLELAQQQLRLWADIGNVIEDGIHGSAPLVSDLSNSFNKELLARLGLKPSDALVQGMRRAAANSVRTYLARQNLGMTLSERVYRNGQVASGRIDRVIDNALLRGASARELARDVAALINPNTPGGVSYAAMRLGRTELNNAFHQASRDSYQANPFVEKVDWNLSGSHPRADECNDLEGTYLPNNVPDKPHPQCLCYTTPAVMSRAQLVKRFKSGEFDEWADRQLSA
jgi:hypothetical protein